MQKKISSICFIVDSDNINYVPLALRLGIKWIQYREKKLTKKEIFLKALELREITNRFGACLVINDYADIALTVDADGVHLGQKDLPLKEAKKIMGDRIIGISTRNLYEAIDAQNGGADYIGFGSIFPTDTKSDIIVQGLDHLKEIVNCVKIPVIAIGGITVDNVRAVFETGCFGVATSSGLLKGDIESNISKFLSSFK